MQHGLPARNAGANPTLPECAGTFSAFRVTDCEFSEFAGSRRSASRPISLAGCNERCVCRAERKPPHAAPRSPFGKLAIWGIFAAKASRTRKRARDIAGNTSGKNTCGRDASLPHVANHISFVAKAQSATRLRRKTARRKRDPTRRCRGSGTAWSRARRR